MEQPLVKAEPAWGLWAFLIAAFTMLAGSLIWCLTHQLP